MVVRLALIAPLAILFAVMLGYPPVASAGMLNSCVECHSRVLLSHEFVQESGIALDDCVGCHRGTPSTRRKDLSHLNLIDGRYAWYRFADSKQLSLGKERIRQFACRRCHVQDRQGNGLAVDLDQLFAQRTVADLDQALRIPAYYMPDFHFSDADRQSLIIALLAAGGQRPPRPHDDVTIVHFEDSDQQQHPFEKNCGACHRVVTAHHGGLGHATIAPNLSGLLTAFYPPNFKDQQPWTAKNLATWIKNPRQVRSLAVMPPLNLTDPQISELIEKTWPVLQGEDQ